MTVSEPNLYVIDLPAGEVPSFDIDFHQSNGRVKYNSQLWLGAGYDGVWFRGQGRDVTFLKPDAANQWVDSNVFIGPHSGIVRFSKMTIGSARTKCIHAGLENHVLPIKKLKIEIRNCRVVTDPPKAYPPQTGLSRVKWALFGYQCDWDVRNTVIDNRESVEHALYAHGFAETGVLWRNVHVVASGAEGLKVTARPGECMWVQGAKVIVQDCKIENWYQDWSWRGGGGIVCQGSGADIEVTRTYLLGSRDYNRSRCFMVDDSGLDFYGPDGQAGVGAANGHVILHQVAGISMPGPDWYSNIARIGTLRPDRPQPLCARSLTMTQCGFYGDKTLLNLARNAIEGAVSISDCNSPGIKNFLQSLGHNVSVQSKVSGLGGFFDLSQGFSG